MSSPNPTSTPVTPAMTPDECAKMPDAFLDHQAHALRARLSSSHPYPEQARDTAELKNLEAEIQKRQLAKQTAEREAHGGVKICKRPADLPGNSVVGAEHWWIQTTRKDVGMGQANGQIPGHGESAPKDLGTKFLDHSKEPATSCTPVDKPVDESCVDRELEVGKDTGPWIPGVNDCHTTVKAVIKKCQKEAEDKALDEVTPKGNEPASRSSQ